MHEQTRFYRIMLGRGGQYASDCRSGNFIGADYEIEVDLTYRRPDDWREFNREFRPIFLNNHPDKSSVAAGLACGALWTITKGLLSGDIVICPDGTRSYLVGEVVGDYEYHPGSILPHRRAVKWFDKTIDRDEMSQALQNSTGSAGTVSEVTKYREEIQNLIGGNAYPVLITTDENIEDPTVFALESHLEEFLVTNWEQTSLGKDYDIFEDEGELLGQQYPTDTGNIDILAISKSKKEWLVVELKRGRASDVVVGQIQR